MPLVAVGTWLVAALAGGHLLYLWLAGGGLRRQATKVTRFPATLIFSHMAFAVTALGCWVVYLLAEDPRYAWISCAVLAVAAFLGFTMFTRWLGGGRHARGAEQRFPVVAVLLHGLAGVATFVLVLLAAALKGG
ncbi:hypothetical protein [Spongiactinospora sp. TRM90649]|uniref:hypothetical protein n=1 Tax=Spongiactinospora sp. TRM90649 TaxID=3031114 RepID=UPI0023F95AFA|nr:hypothetical protein [Spongiactinospora sp. TRM90649]MDF5757891.1 hypothetical protein [Spongiactinospora sp. TRM90649]